MPPILTGNMAKALYPGVSAWYGMAYNEHKPEYPDLFSYNKSTRNFEEEVGVTGFGLATIKSEGQSITYDTQFQGYIKRYTHVTYGLGFIITMEMMEDDLYDVVGRRRARGLAFSMRQTKEITGANVFNRAFNSSYTGGDAKEMCATDHPNVSGGTWANELTIAADLSEASLEQACIDIGKWTDDRGSKIAVRPQRLVIPNDLEFEAIRILQSTLQNDTANNAINAIKAVGKIPQGYRVNHYFNDTDAWFIITDCPDGTKYFERRPDKFAVDNDFDTENAKFKSTGRWSFGWTDPRGVFGSPGA